MPVDSSDGFVIGPFFARNDGELELDASHVEF
jgi:hypothetical protein